MDPFLAETIKLVFVAGAAWASVKTSLNGARKDITEIKATVAKIDEKVGAHSERIAKLEARQEADR